MTDNLMKNVMLNGLQELHAQLRGETIQPIKKVRTMNRYKRDDLEALLASLNKNIGPSSQVELDYYKHASPRGGYCLVYKDDNGHHATPRMPIREMYQYLQGALDWVTPDRV
tara:strand:+ start:540 stop:875 length:336 start_codon:yes stop_codon:yes gene_type:complete